MDIQSMDKPSVLLELKRMAQQNLPIKGTYVKTLKQEDIFEQPVNKTTELHAVKLGKQQILVPIIKEEEISQGAISDDLVMKLLSKIKDKKSRQILSAYVEQEQQETLKPVIIPKKEGEEDKVAETDEIVLLKEKKDDIVKTARTLKTMKELNEYLESENIEEFKKELKDNKLSNTLAAFTRTINALKRRIETKGFIEMKKTEAEESKRKAKEDEEQKKLKAKEEAEESKRKAKAEAEESKRKAKEQKEKEQKEIEEAMKFIEGEKKEPKQKKKKQKKKEEKQKIEQMNLKELRQEMAETTQKMKEDLEGKGKKELEEIAKELFAEIEKKGASISQAIKKTVTTELIDKYGYHPLAYPKEIRNNEEAKAIYRDEMEKGIKIGQAKREANAKSRALIKEREKEREEKQLDLVDKFILEMEQKGVAKAEAQKYTASKSYKESIEYIIGNVLKNKLKKSETLKKIDEMLKQTKQKDKAKAEEFIDKVINDAAKDLKEEEQQNIRKAKEEADLKKRKAKEEADLKKREEDFFDEINKKLSNHQNVYLRNNTESLSELQSRKERLDKMTEEKLLELKQKIKEAKSGKQKRKALKDFDKYIKYRGIDISKLPGDYYFKLEKEIEKEEEERMKEEEIVKEVKRKLTNLKAKLKKALTKSDIEKIQKEIDKLEK